MRHRLHGWAAIGIVLLALAGCGPVTFVVGLDPGDQKMTATVVERERGAGRNRVAIIDVSGRILNGRELGLLRQGENPVSELHERLRLAANDPNVKAVILRINSPGGGVTASDIMYRDIRRFREQTGKPVVALLMDVAASGGYYVACSTDHIVAYPTSVTGSIGVILQTISLQPALNRIGIETDAIVSGPNKDAGSFLSTLDPEERAILQGMVDDFYGRFVGIVREARPEIPEADFAAVTDGRVMSGADAVRLGLADETGDLFDAWTRAKEAAGIGAADLVIYHRPLQYVGSPYAQAQAQPDPAGEPSGGGTQVNLAQINLHGGGLGGLPDGFYYLWTPHGR